MSGLTIPVLLGSVRRDRIGIRAAHFVTNELRSRGHTPHLVDPLELGLGLLDRMYKEYRAGEAPPELETLAALYRRADAFVVVSAEYNHSVPPALSNLLDHFLEEYFFRPSAIVSYSAGRFGGVRAAMQLRAMLSELGMPSIPSLLPIGLLTRALDEQGRVLDDAALRGSGKFFDELEWYARALSSARAQGTPY